MKINISISKFLKLGSVHNFIHLFPIKLIQSA